MKTSESRKLTNLLKKSQKMFWLDKDMNKCTIGFAYNHPRDIDWVVTGSAASYLYDEIHASICVMRLDGKKLTARQRELLELD